MRTYRTYSSQETKTLGAVLAEKMLAANRRGGRRGAQVFTLQGDLGAGKTTFTQGFLRALGARSRVTSPTFVLMKRFPLANSAKKAGFTDAYHVDAYRFRAAAESDALGLQDILRNPQSIVLVEWPERLGRLIPRSASRIRFAHGRNEDERRIVIS